MLLLSFMAMQIKLVVVVVVVVYISNVTLQRNFSSVIAKEI